MNPVYAVLNILSQEEATEVLSLGVYSRHVFQVSQAIKI